MPSHRKLDEVDWQAIRNYGHTFLADTESVRLLSAKIRNLCVNVVVLQSKAVFLRNEPSLLKTIKQQVVLRVSL
jgi:hypothetical protein